MAPVITPGPIKLPISKTKNVSTKIEQPKRIGHTKENEWSKKDIAYLTKHYPTGSLIAVASQLNRSYTAIRGKADKLNLKRENRYWSHGDEQWLIDNWQVMTAVEIGAELGKTRWAIINKFRELTGKRKGFTKLSF